VRRQAALHRIGEHLAVVVLQRVTDVHHHHQATQGLAGTEVLVDEGLPVRLQVQRHLGVAVPGKVDQLGLRGDFEEHQLLGAAGGLGDPGQAVLAGQGVEGTGLASI